MTQPLINGLTQAAYAKRRGVSRPYVHKLYHEGRLKVNADGTIDADASDAMLARSSDPTRGGDGGGGVLTRAMEQESNAKPLAAEMTALPDTGTPMTMTEAKTASAIYRAKQDEAEYRKSVKELVESARADAGIADAFGVVGRALEQLADRMAARLAAETDPRRMHALLIAEFDAVRTEIANAIESLPETLTATRQ